MAGDLAGRGALRRSATSFVGPAEVVNGFDGPAGAYLHVPFCPSICPFCPYNKVLAEDDLARRYFAALGQEVDWYLAARQAAGEGPFTSLYLGGGTPTCYPEALAEVIERIPVEGERAIEVLPNHGTPARLGELARMGITAVSIGAQSFHDEVLQRLGRPHDAATSRSAVETALGQFGCVDVDLIVDVALEGEGALRGMFLEDLRACFELGVDQVSTYPLMRFGFTPFGRSRHDRGLEHAVLREATRLAGATGYERRSVWTFNKKGSIPYTSITRRRFLGMGAGSSTFAGRDFYVNHFGVATYADAVERGRLPIARWLRLGRWGGAAYEAFWQAYAGGIDETALSSSYGPLVARLAHVGLAPVALAGMLQAGERGYRLTPAGFDRYHDLERLVTYQLIEPLWAEMLSEHAKEPGALEGRASWLVPGRARASLAWRLTRGVFERPVRTGC